MTRETKIRWMAFVEGKTVSQMELEMLPFDDETVEKQYRNDRNIAKEQINDRYASSF